MSSTRHTHASRPQDRRPASSWPRPRWRSPPPSRAVSAAFRPASRRRSPPRPGPESRSPSPAEARAEAVTGMVYVAISRDNREPPIEQASPDRRAAVLEVRRRARARSRRGDRPGPIAAIRSPACATCRPASTGCSRSSTCIRASRGRTARRCGCTTTSGRDRTGNVAREPAGRPGQGHLRSEVGGADPAGGAQSHSPDPAARRHRDGEAVQDSEQHPDEMVGAADLPRRDRAAAQGLRQASGRALPRQLRPRPLFPRRARRLRAAAASSTGSGSRPIRRDSST